ncbi:MAG TPA: TRAM domain-containing protein, partial [bacterium]
MRRERHGHARTGRQTLSIERLAGGGDGVGHIGGKAVFVPLAAPGDVVEAAIVEDRSRYCRARVLRVVVPSPDRVEPPCPLFGDCGGCAWQHVAYRAQLAAKRAVVEDALRRIGRLEPPPVPAVIPSPREYGYRHRARLHAVRAGGDVVLGFFRAGSHSVVPVASCPVLHPSLDAALAALAAAMRACRGTIPAGSEVRADTGWDGAAVRLSVSEPGGAPLDLPPALQLALRAAGDAAGVAIDAGGPSAAPLALPLGPGEDALVTTGATFTQVNLEQNRALVAAALEMAEARPGTKVLDLCCGLGNLSLPAAAHGARVLGVDLDAEAVRQAR